MTRRRAFTLIELIVILTVMIVAAVAVIPSFVQFQRQSQLNWAVRRTVSLATEARGLAVARDTVVTLRYDEAAHGMRFLVDPGEAELEEAAGPPAAVPPGEASSPDTRLLEYALDVEVQIENPEAALEPVLRFYPDGRADPARVRFGMEGFSPLSVTVTPRTGRTSVKQELLP